MEENEKTNDEKKSRKYKKLTNELAKKTKIPVNCIIIDISQQVTCEKLAAFSTNNLDLFHISFEVNSNSSFEKFYFVFA